MQWHKYYYYAFTVHSVLLIRDDDIIIKFTVLRLFWYFVNELSQTKILC